MQIPQLHGTIIINDQSINVINQLITTANRNPGWKIDYAAARLGQQYPRRNIERFGRKIRAR